MKFGSVGTPQRRRPSRLSLQINPSAFRPAKCPNVVDRRRHDAAATNQNLTGRERERERERDGRQSNTRFSCCWVSEDQDFKRAGRYLPQSFIYTRPKGMKIETHIRFEKRLGCQNEFWSFSVSFLTYRLQLGHYVRKTRTHNPILLFILMS